MKNMIGINDMRMRSNQRLLFMLCLSLLLVGGCSKQAETIPMEEESILPAQEHSISEQPEEALSRDEEEDMRIQVTINDTHYLAKLNDTEAAYAFMAKLPLTITMEDLHSNEKYYYFDTSFPTAAQPVSNIQAGDIKLFGSDCLVLFYKNFPTTYSYTSLGEIENPEGLLAAVGSGSVTVRFEKAE